jgi:hypothetical protein
VVPEFPPYKKRRDMAVWLLSEAAMQVCHTPMQITHVSRVFAKGVRTFQMHAVVVQKNGHGKKTYTGLVCSYRDGHDSYVITVGVDHYVPTYAISGQGITRWIVRFGK